MKNSSFFPANEKDDAILKHLKDVRIKPVEGNRTDFTVEFEFSENEFFTPTILTKTYIFDKETEEVEKSVGCNIKWSSADKNPSIEVKTKKVKKGKSVETKKIESEVPSFFDLFNDTDKEDPAVSDESNFWKDDFFGNSLEYYLNIIDTDMFGAGEDFEDEEDEDEDDDDEPKAKKAKKPKAAGGDAKNEKCKNQ